jgi:hypothetical protein
MVNELLKKTSIIILLITIIIGTIILAGCAKKECEKSSDCPTSKCFTGRCVEGSCTKVAKENCCGNRKCESDYGENRCECPEDCGGKCEGKIKYNVTTTTKTRTLETKYAQYVCNENKECVIGASQADINILKLTNTMDESGVFKAEILSTLNQPYNTATDGIEIRIRLTDLTLKPISGITFTSIQVLSGSSLLGEKIIKNNVLSVGDIFTESLKLSSSQKLVEEEKTFDIKIGYEYQIMEKENEITKRSSKIAKLSEKITVISP